MAKNTVIPATLDFRRTLETSQKAFAYGAYIGSVTGDFAKLPLNIFCPSKCIIIT